MRKVVSQYNGSSWTIASDKRFVYDGWNLIEEQEISPASSRFYVWGLDLSQSLQGAGGIGGLLATVSGSTTDHFLYDGNGNVGQLINAVGGSLDAQYEYDPYGNLISSTGTLSASNPFRFSTKYLDAETGLYYYGYRYYSPETGRWLTRDPIEELGFLFTASNTDTFSGDPGINPYGFAFNSPIDHYDFLGLAIETAWDAFNVGSGVISLGCNIASGNVIGALVDGIGLTYDAVATIVPGLPGGAQWIIKIYRSGNIAPKMYRFLEANQTARNIYRFGVRKGVDEAHHIIPRAGSPINWTNKTLRRQMDQLRAKAKKVGFDIDGAENGVALPKDWHKNNTLGQKYYERVLETFRNANTREQFINESSKLADVLLKESRKIQ